jgi:hypothetical protein
MNKTLLLCLLSDLLFAYVNKDEDNPHDFEINAVNQAVDVLLKEYPGTKYSKKFFQDCRL